ncbi:hypothetical protein [Rahnella sp. BIGb0236]|uniref:hypothetical protein n=1 Tax=Rahnella sp. BIGb0236 TaxID=2485117 RepID=UPI0010604B74|nr:hypothetical protein [Rahnella sp. BIGb0236]
MIDIRFRYETAREACFSELQRDCERSEGNMAQEARREEYQIELRNADHSAKLALDAQEIIVSDLTKLYSTI